MLRMPLRNKLPGILILFTALFLPLSPYAADIVFVTASSDKFSHPHDLVLDPSGKYLFVSDMNNDSIRILDSQSLKVLGEFGHGELSSPHDVEFDTKGKLVVADSGNHRLVTYIINGLSVKQTTVLSAGMRSPEGVAVSADGDLYVANTGSHNIVHFKSAAKNQVFNETGKSGRSESEFIRPHDVGIWGNRLYVSDPGNNRIKILSLDLQNLQILSGPTYSFDEPKYLALDEQGRLFVADQYNNRIQIFAAYPKHNELVASISTYTIDNRVYTLNKPEGVEAHGAHIWVSDTYNNRILLYKWLE
ncbi:NHL repeat-containing protein [Kaarinaea lacus]